MSDAATLASIVVALAVLLWPDGQRGWCVSTSNSRSTTRGIDRVRDSDVEPSVSETLQHLALALQGGSGLQPALHEVAAASPGTTRTELMAVAAAMAWGLPHDAAWAHAPERWEPARRALMLASRAGVAPTPMLTAAATDLRRDQVARVDEATAGLSVKLVLPLGLAFLPAFVLTTVVPVVLALAATVLDVG